MASLGIIVRQRREILGLKREVRRHTRGIASPAEESDTIGLQNGAA